MRDENSSVHFTSIVIECPSHHIQPAESILLIYAEIEDRYRLCPGNVNTSELEGILDERPILSLHIKIMTKNDKFSKKTER